MTWRNDRRWMWVAAASLVCFYSFLFLRDALSGALSTDAAKYALNIPYPHPPLGRWFMLASQAIFGPTVFAARLPSFLAELTAIFFFFRASTHKLPAFLLSLSPAFLFFLGQGYQTSFVMAAIALIAYGAARGQPNARLVWISAGYLLAIWTQLQGLLLLPAVLLFFFADHHASFFKLLFANILAHTFLVALWLVGSPLAAADALQFAGASISLAEKVQTFISAIFSPFAVFLCALNVAHLVRWWERKHATASSVAMLVSSIIFLAYIFSNPASYYFPYIFALCFWSLIELRLVAKNAYAALVIVFIVFFGAETLLFGPTLVRSRPSTDAHVLSELRAFLADRGDVMALGTYGYDRSFILRKVFIRFATDPAIRERVTAVVVFYPETLSAEEREFLATYTGVTQYGDMTVYTK